MHFAGARIRVQPRRGKERSEPETGLARSLQWTIVASVLPQPDVVHAGAEDALLLKAGEGAGEIADTAQKQCLQRFLSLDPINRVSYLESHCYMLNTLLRDADFMRLSLGLEVRVPRIDHLLAKAALALPEKCKINGTQKRLLVEALQESLPSEIVNRPKRGFTLPFEHWMREDLRSEIEPILTAKHVKSGPLCALLSRREVEQVWNQFLAGKLSWTRPWSLYVVQRWCESHSVTD